jgi:hypothetical protein
LILITAVAEARGSDRWAGRPPPKLADRAEAEDGWRGGSRNAPGARDGPVNAPATRIFPSRQQERELGEKTARESLKMGPVIDPNG